MEQFDDQASWERWLAVHGTASPGVWLKIAKAAAPRTTVTKQQAIETAISHGWIDGQLSAFDAEYFLIRFTPRKPGSKWSALNVETAERLLRESRVTPAGLREIEAAKSDGRWASAYVGQRRQNRRPISSRRCAPRRKQSASLTFSTARIVIRLSIAFRMQRRRRRARSALRRTLPCLRAGRRFTRSVRGDAKASHYT